MGTADSVLTQLKAWLAQAELPADGRLPPERELCEVLGVTRNELRKTLATLERDGEVWRQVGKGTFVGARPSQQLSVAAIATATNPLEVMRARLLIEPMLAGEASVHATGRHLDELHQCLRIQREADTWRRYENADNLMHRAVAEATRNTVLLALFDQLNAVRRAIAWGRQRPKPDHPPTDHHSFGEHEAIVSAITERNPDSAYESMYDHLVQVRDKLVDSRPPAARRIRP